MATEGATTVGRLRALIADRADDEQVTRDELTEALGDDYCVNNIWEYDEPYD